MFPAIFLDRDGVLIENRADYVRDWSQVKIYPEAVKALAFPQVKNYKIVIVTNQSAVGRGLVLQETVDEINNQLIHLIHYQGGQMDAVYMCPHKPDDGCLCRKPKPGLLLQAARELSLNLSRSWMIGDAWSDVLAGQAAGVKKAILLKTGRGKEQLQEYRPDTNKEYLVIEDLPLALVTIFAIDNSPIKNL